MQHQGILDWDSVRIAAEVGRKGSIARAAEGLNLHQNTVNRHVEALELSLGAKLFHRHSQGMTMTETGIEMLRIADATLSQFGELYRQSRGHDAPLEGDFVVTSVDVLTPLILPLISKFEAQHPQISIRYVASDTRLRLAYGEADIAFRIGSDSENPDNVVTAFGELEMAVFVRRSYLQERGLNETTASIKSIKFVGPDQNAPNAPFIEWMRSNISESNIAFRTNSIQLMWQATLSGYVAGFLPTSILPNPSDFVQIVEPKPEWRETVSIVTHVDLHRSRKVQAFLMLIR